MFSRNSTKKQQKAIEVVKKLLNEAGLQEKDISLRFDYAAIKKKVQTSGQYESSKFFYANLIVNGLDLDIPAKDNLKSRLYAKRINSRSLIIIATSFVTAILMFIVKCRSLRYSEVNGFNIFDVSAITSYLLQGYLTFKMLRIVNRDGSGNKSVKTVVTTRLRVSFTAASTTLPILLLASNLLIGKLCFEKVCVKLHFTSDNLDAVSLRQSMTVTVTNNDEPKDHFIKKRETVIGHESDEIEVIAHKNSPSALVIKNIVGEQGQLMEFDSIAHNPEPYLRQAEEEKFKNSKTTGWKYEVFIK